MKIKKEQDLINLLALILQKGELEEDKIVYPEPILTKIKRPPLCSWLNKRLLNHYLFLENNGHAYTYQERFQACLEELKETSRAAIPIFWPEDLKKSSRPCLINIILAKDLYFIFRSHDMLLGYPYNLFLLEKFKEEINQQLGMKYKDFKVLSFNAHVYIFRDMDLLKRLKLLKDQLIA